MRQAWDRAEREMEQRLPGIVVENFGGACPTQGDGMIVAGPYAGLRWYFRFRHDEATLSLYTPADPEEAKHSWGYLNLSETRYYAELIDATGVEDNGWLTPAEGVELMVRLWEALRPREEYESTGHDRLGEAVQQMTAALEEGRLVIREEPLANGMTLVHFDTPTEGS